MTTPSLPPALRKLFFGECPFIAGATDTASFIPPSLPEIAVIGRSNVGKSSLLNALTGRSRLARVSHTPGRTRQINFFRLSQRCILVDLPGYGYAKASKKMIASWDNLAHDYFRTRTTLRRVLVLVDARFGLKPSDETTLYYLDGQGVTYQIVLTKIDKISSLEKNCLLDSLRESRTIHSAMHPDIIATSTRSGEGIVELQLSLASLILPGNYSECG